MENQTRGEVGSYPSKYLLMRDAEVITGVNPESVSPLLTILPFSSLYFEEAYGSFIKIKLEQSLALFLYKAHLRCCELKINFTGQSRSDYLRIRSRNKVAPAKELEGCKMFSFVVTQKLAKTGKADAKIW